MASGKQTTTLSAELETELAKVRGAAPPPPTEDPIYEYLTRVYRLRRKLEKDPEWQKRLTDYGNAHHRNISHKYVRLIIELTAGDHVTTKMKYKYTVVLIYALQKGVKTADLKAFIKGLGGLNKCVEFASKQAIPVAVKKSPKKTGEREVKRWGQVTRIQAPPSETPHRRPLH